MDVRVDLISIAEEIRVAHFNNFEAEVQDNTVVQIAVFNLLKIVDYAILSLQIEIYLQIVIFVVDTT